jgi:hypothetical protein
MRSGHQAVRLPRRRALRPPRSPRPPIGEDAARAHGCVPPASMKSSSWGTTSRKWPSAQCRVSASAREIRGTRSGSSSCAPASFPLPAGPPTRADDGPKRRIGEGEGEGSRHPQLLLLGAHPRPCPFAFGRPPSAPDDRSSTL